MPRYDAPEDLLKDRVVLITGAAEGLGRAVALSYAQHGATTILLDKNVKKLEALYDEIESNKWPQPAIYPMDLEGANADDYGQLAENIDKEFERLDGIVHNAAVMGHITPLHLADLEAWFKVMQINLHAPLLLNQTCIPLLNASDDSRILFVSDACAHQGSAYLGAYAISKAGLESMMQILADELEANTPIQVNSIDPGVLRTQMRAFAYPGEDPENNPQPETVMPGFLFLMGPESKQFNGRSFLAEDFL